MMMRLKGPIFLAGVALALAQAPQIAAGQGKGGGKEHKVGHAQGKGQDKPKAKEQNKGQGKVRGEATGRIDRQVAKERGRGQGNNKVKAKSFTRLASLDKMPRSVRRWAISDRAHSAILAAAVSHAFARGRGDDFRIVEIDNGMRIANRSGIPLVFLDDDRARNLGKWRVGVLDDKLQDGGPSFCRSGAGHPVWGRQWCFDKGFGVGSFQDYRWGRTDDLGDIVFSRDGFGGRLLSNALMSALGTTTFNRLALHAVTLGLVDPLEGMWVSESTGPQLMMVRSGALPVAEMVDVNRDYRADYMLVALRPW